MAFRNLGTTNEKYKVVRHTSYNEIQILLLKNNQLEIFGKNFCPSNISIKCLITGNKQ